MYNYERPNIISLHGHTGVGKDTLAEQLNNAHHLKFATQLRLDTAGMYYDGVTTPLTDEMMRTPNWSGGMSFKECMVQTGRAFSTTDPYRYCRQLAEELRYEVQMTGQNMFVVSDCRKRIEFDTLLELGNVWAFRIHRINNPYKEGALDNLLDDLILPAIWSYGKPTAMLEELKTLMVTTSPYRHA